MFRLLSLLIDGVSVGLFIIPIVFVFQSVLCKGRTLWKKVIVVAFTIYLALIFSTTGMPSINSLVIDLNVNLIPIIDIMDSPIDYLKNTVLNICLFVPLGFLVPIIWNKEYGTIKNSMLLGLKISLMIEILQIFTFRLTDIDDLITNTIGVMIGFCISKNLKKFEADSSLNRTQMTDKKEVLWLTLIALSVVFFLKPFISSVLWLIIYK